MDNSPSLKGALFPFYILLQSQQRQRWLEDQWVLESFHFNYVCSLTENSLWWIEFNESVPLNGTKVVALGSLDLRGLGQLNLNYIEPAGSLETALSEIFHVNHDSMQPNPATYNKDAIQETSTSSKATPTSSPLSSNLLATTDRILISSTMIPQPSASSPAPNNKASSSIQGGDIASIILGAILGILVAALIILHRIRRRREQRVSSEASRSVPLSPLATLPDSHLYEKDAVTPPNELPCNHSWAELPAPRR